MHCYPQDSIAFVRKSVKEFVPTMDSNLTVSLMKLLDCFFAPFHPKDVSIRIFSPASRAYIK